MKRQRQRGWLKSLRLPELSFGNSRTFNLAEHFVHRPTGVTAPTISVRSLTKKYWVLSRALYIVRIIDLRGVPASKRNAAIVLAQTAWTPFTETAHYVIPQQDRALLCAWNTAVVSTAQLQNDVDSENVTVLPEAALRLAPISSDDATALSHPGQTVEIAEALDGVIATVAFATQITAEQWWPTIPSSASWLNFQRSSSLPADARSNLPPTQTIGWRRAPIGYSGGAMQNTTTAWEWRTIAIAAWLLVVPTIWYTNEWRQVFAMTNEARGKLSVTERELNATLGARAQALDGLDRARNMAALFNRPDNLLLFALVNDVLTQTTQSGTLQLAEWDLRGPQLKFALVAPGGGAPTATALVKALELAKTVRDVEVNVDGARIVVSLRVVPSNPTTELPVANTIPATAIAPKPGSKK